MERITEFIRGIIQEDDSLTDANNCRDSVSKIVNKVKEKFPTAKTSVLVYPEAHSGDGVHYSLLVDAGSEKTLVNAVAAPGFPEYIGDPSIAVPTFSAMKETSKVI